MGYGATSAPTIQTGNPQWDRNLGGLAHIFGTPGGYERGLAAGAAAREALLKGDQTISERNAAIALYNAQRGLDATGQPQMPPPPTYRPSGVVGGAPIMEQPPGLVTSTGTPTGPPPSVAPQAPSLWDRIIGRTPPQQTPPAASPAPNAGAPAAPNTTASDGSVPSTGEPPNHTVNTTGGGRQYAPAANADGSPRPPPLNINTIIGLATLAGQNAQQAQLTGEALIAGGFEHGIIPWHTANSAMGGQGQSATQLAALIGNTAPYQSVQGTIQNAATNATTLERERIQQGGETQRTGMTIGGENYRFDQGVEVSQDASGQPVYTRRKDIVPGQTRAFQPQVYASDSQRAAAMDKPVSVYQLDANGNPDISKPLIPMKIGEALQKRQPMPQESTDAVNAALRGAALTGDVSQPASRLADTVATTTAAGNPPVTADEAFKTLQGREKVVESAYAPSERGMLRTEAAASTPQARYAINDYADYIRRTNPRMSPDVANLTAIQDLQQQGYLPSQSDVHNWRTVSASNLFVGNKDIETQVIKGGTAGKFMIPLMKDYVSPLTKLRVPANPDKGAPGSGGQPTPQPNKAAAPAKPASTAGRKIGRAPPGAVAGAAAEVNGVVGTVGDDGFIYAPQ